MNPGLYRISEQRQQQRTSLPRRAVARVLRAAGCMCGGLACRCTVAYGVPIHPSSGHHITRCAWHDFGTSEAGQRRARTQAPCTRTARRAISPRGGRCRHCRGRGPEPGVTATAPACSLISYSIFSYNKTVSAGLLLLPSEALPGL